MKYENILRSYFNIIIPNYSMFLSYLADCITKTAMCFHNISVHNTGLLLFISLKPFLALFMEFLTNFILLESIPQF
jgi:hypothetical protein